MKRNRSSAAMTLVEVVIAMTVLAISMGGIFSILMQSRRLTEGSIAQNSALTIVQGYLEQMKNMELGGVDGVTGGFNDDNVPTLDTNSHAIKTKLDNETDDFLWTSTGNPPDLSTITPGTTPVGVVDNLRAFDMMKDLTDTEDDTADAGDATTDLIPWTTAWPNARAFPSTATVGRTHLKMNLWVWVNDLSGGTAHARAVFGITIIYTYQYLDGGKQRYHIGTVRTVRSNVPSI